MNDKQEQRTGFSPRVTTGKGKHNVSVKVSPWRHKQIKDMARKSRISIDELMRQILEYALGEEP